MVAAFRGLVQLVNMLKIPFAFYGISKCPLLYTYTAPSARTARVFHVCAMDDATAAVVVDGEQLAAAGSAAEAADRAGATGQR